MVRWCWVNVQCRGALLIWIRVGQGPIALVVGTGGGCLDIFSLLCPFSRLSPSLWETARYRLKYCLKGPLNPKQPTNQTVYDIETYPGLQELPLTGTNFYGPKPVRPSKVLLIKNLIESHSLGDGLYKLEASDQILIVHSVHSYVIVFRNKYCLNQSHSLFPEIKIKTSNILGCWIEKSISIFQT